MHDWQMPDGHPISLQRAKELMAGELGRANRDILKATCAPIYWYAADRADSRILHNGTVTFVRTPERLLGVTANHVIVELERDASSRRVRLQIWDAVVDDLFQRIVDRSERLDISTFAVDEGMVRRLGKQVVPLGDWPPRPPQEGRGIMLAGYPAIERSERGRAVTFGLFTALVIARTVTETQITWVIERDWQVPNAEISAPPENYNLGGVSGGPLIGWFESENHISTFTLSGIVTEHPDYERNEFSVERVVAVRADAIQSNGRIVGQC